jgi:hypothetical protein
MVDCERLGVIETRKTTHKTRNLKHFSTPQSSINAPATIARHQVTYFFNGA